MTDVLRLDSYRGCLLGLAVGDAVGTTLEFRRPGSFTPIADMVGGGPFALEPGQWTDDTSMALCLAESLIESGRFDPQDQLGRYVDWYRNGHLASTGECFDIGNTIRGALTRFEQSGESYPGSTDPHSAGNGSIMRLAPVPMRYASDPVLAIERAADSSRTTHGAATAVDACRYLSGLVVGALGGASKREVLSDRYCPALGYWADHSLVPEIDEIAAGSFKLREPPEIVGSGYVVKSLEAALWALHRGRDFREGCLLAVNLGDDADTTAAVYGQLAGALWGASAIPDEWLDKLTLRDRIEAFADDLHSLASDRM
jgi:ADP-ribosylglycohydrolase